ncbi:hypothetical protein D6T63_12160 [Arthrobacter cheniae]|uniref:Uncharacterized protein n=2 Tax=Arthrobacter cheniae TaxID=1258888 RepID=A0A3A5MBW7_9MICC|nr:hypothetical protein D6T63_12160 [Arthrobacter cheniae]
MVELLNPALAELQKILSKETTSDSDRLRAIQMVLDRTGNHATSGVIAEVELKPWQNMVDGLLVDMGETVEQPALDAGQDLDDEKASAAELTYQHFEEEVYGGDVIPTRIVGSKNPPKNHR